MKRDLQTFLRRVGLPWILTAIWGLAQERPNVILIVTDDQGYGDMACHGNPWLKTPHLDRLHAESVRLEDFHVDPVCTPTRAALMTGRHSLRTGAWAVTEGRQLLNPDETTMAQVFADSGYKTGMFGKWHLGDTYPYAPRFRGFQEVVCHRAGGIDEIGNPKGNSYFDDTLYRNGKPEKFEGYCTDVFFREAMRFAKTHQDTPFFIYLPLNAMHSPFTVAEMYWKRFAETEHPEKRAKFYGMIENFDENLGHLFTTLKELAIEEKTLVIFMSDNGTAAGQFSAGMRGKKGSVYEGGHRVACFARWPGTLKAGLEIERLTSHYDWLPTLIDLCQLKPPDKGTFDGRSLAPLLRQEEVEWPDRTIVIERQADKLIKAARVLPGRGYPQFAVLAERWRFVNGELYDIVADPGQTTNLTPTHPQVAEKLYQIYEKHFATVTAHRGAYTPFYLGANLEPNATFTVRDWHPTEGRVIWKKSQLSDDKLYINGFWAIDMRTAGRYKITLARHPHDDLKPIGAKKARLKIGETESVIELEPEATQAVFELDLKPGHAILQTWLTDSKTGKDRGAYFVSAYLQKD